MEPKNINDIEKEFDQEFPDPMTRKYGDGIVLYCSFCHGKNRDKFKDFLRSQFTSLLKGMPLEEEDEHCGNDDVAIGKNLKSRELNQWREEALK